MRTPHTATYTGKRVRVGLKDGTVIVDKFITRTDRYVFLAFAGRIAKADIKSFSTYRQRGSDTILKR